MGHVGLTTGVRAPDGLFLRDQGEWRDAAAANSAGSPMSPSPKSRVGKWTSIPFFFGDFPLADLKPKVQPGGGAMTGGAENARAPHSYTLPLGTPLSFQGGRKCLRSNEKC